MQNRCLSSIIISEIILYFPAKEQTVLLADINKKTNMKVLLIPFALLWTFLLIGQNDHDLKVEQQGNKRHKIQCISEVEYSNIKSIQQENLIRLESEGRLLFKKNNSINNFEWPLRQASGFNHDDYYVITNYVDLDNTSGLLDYNCGERTYDGHRGTDIALFPFSWILKNEKHVEVIAAAPGIISYKQDGNFDEECSICPSCISNTIIITHADGSEAWYAHMKNGSLTNKLTGDAIATGEYLGTVASSGNSTGPHLHFEIRDANNTVIDPYFGNCSSSNGTSHWLNQKAYREPSFLNLSTHDAPPAMNSCAPDQPNFRNYYYPGETMYVMQSMRDLPNLTQRTMNIYDANNNVYTSWTQTNPNTKPSGHFTSFWWWNTRTLSNNVTPGKWTFEVSFLNQTSSHEFIVLPTGAVRPSNDDCQNATFLSASAANCSPIIVNNTHSTPSIENPDFICSQQGLTRDLWFYTVAPPSGNVSVATSQTNGGLTDMVMTAYRGNCGSLEIIACDDDSGIGLHSAISLSGLNPGELIWLRLIPYLGELTGEFAICASDIACPNSLVLNGNEISNSYYETNGIISSTQQIIGQSNVIYDSATEVSLQPIFEVQLGSVFTVYIDGFGNIY